VDDRAVLIYNPIVKDSHIGGHRAHADSISPKTRFVAIGRLSRQKGFDVLIHAFSKVEGDSRLDIFGNGSEYDALSELVSSNGLESRVFLRGHTDNPYRVLDEADWMIMPSRFEGFGVVLVEAMARGVPAIASDCPHGPSEILDNGRFGVLVRPGDVNDLTSALQEVIRGRYQYDSKYLRKRALDYSVSRSVDHWLELLGRSEDKRG
jgi:glycosyltransferase involved in cell wall biosynthesis